MWLCGIKAWSSKFLSTTTNCKHCSQKPVASGFQLGLKQRCVWKLRLSDALKKKVICGLRWASNSHYTQSQTSLRVCNLLNYIPTVWNYLHCCFEGVFFFLKTDSAEQQRSERRSGCGFASVWHQFSSWVHQALWAYLIVRWNRLTVDFKLVAQDHTYSGEQSWKYQ